MFVPEPVFDFHLMDYVLDDIETRVLGSLVEKDITTPDYYPLSLNALINACNQKNNRDPVMNLDEDAVRQALHGLQEKRLAGPAGDADSRVSKYEHRLQEVFNFTRGEMAVICVLLLRGPQTPGELRGRSERMHRFEDISELQSVLQRLMQREPPLVKVLPRQPGTKEARFAHLFSGDVQGGGPETVASTEAASISPRTASADRAVSADDGRIARLEEEMAALRSEIADLKQQLAEFRKQFE
ncbi:MAG TPA: DUF480 domain-containing protein [Terriglobales bacterium]|nr:DUF480 domain-containing protein [Terriglobales bacterium]